MNIKCNFFTIFHSQLNKSSKQVNQDVEIHFRKYCNYMQDDWAEWLIMIEFSNNNRLSKITKLTFFFANKDFHLRMTFKSDDIIYNFIQKRLLIAKTENIIDIMINILKFMQSNVERFRKTMSTQINKHRKLVQYNFDDLISLNNRNIKTIRLSKKLNDKMLNLYKMLKKKRVI